MTAIAHEGTYRCYDVTASGRGRLYRGCSHRTPKEAIRHSDELSREEPVLTVDETDPALPSMPGPSPASSLPAAVVPPDGSGDPHLTLRLTP